MPARKMCFDRILPTDRARVMRTRSYDSDSFGSNRRRAISLIGKQWPNGSLLKIRFLDGTAQQRDMVKEIALEWTRHANLDFDFVDDPTADVRVTFDANDGAWSYVGTDNQSIPLHAATLNLGWQDEAVILHEFGHMIGLSHEHQNPQGGLQWNEEVVIRELAGPPNFWDEATVRHNVLDKYRVDQLHGTKFDPKSIMLYAFPAEWTLDGFATQENEKLSDLDQQFIRGEKMYPRDAEDQIMELAVAQAFIAEIGQAGEIDRYSFEVDTPGTVTVQTLGTSDLVMLLYGPNSQTTRIAEDDDSGGGRNAMITAALESGTYHVEVRHFDPVKTGEYRILVTR